MFDLRVDGGCYTTAALAFATSIIILGACLLRRPAFPKEAPVRSPEDWPILGSLRFFTQHVDFNLKGLALSHSNNFSFYLGKHQIVSIGAKGRKTYFESHALDAGEGYATLLMGTSNRQVGTNKASKRGGHQAEFGKYVVLLLSNTYLSRRAPVLAGDVTRVMIHLIRRASRSAEIMNPTEEIYHVVWQLTNRLLGADEIADSPELLERSLRIFEHLSSGADPLRVIFPAIPTLSHVRRLLAGAKLFGMLSSFVDKRKVSSNGGLDALQFLMDIGEDKARITAFIAGGLVAGQLNTGVNAAWLLIYLAANKHWYDRVQEEVDRALTRRFTGHNIPATTAINILSSLSFEEWTSEFPLIDHSLKETIRFELPGTFCRKNTSGRPIPIAESEGEAIPKDAYAVFLTDNCHFNADIYTDPLRWDPGRYMDGRAEDAKEPYSYVGWGVGRNSCLGMKAAKMEVIMVTAFFFALFDFHLVDSSGQFTNMVPEPARSRFGAGVSSGRKPKLLYKLRDLRGDVET